MSSTRLKLLETGKRKRRGGEEEEKGRRRGREGEEEEEEEEERNDIDMCCVPVYSVMIHFSLYCFESMKV